MSLHLSRDTMSASVAVYRNIYTEDRFQQAYGSEDSAGGSMRLREKLADRCRCSRRAWLHLLRERVPIFRWLPTYRLRKWILGDTVAGLTVGILHIPQGMAFALLTSVAPIFGLYTSFFPVIIYMFFGTGRHVSTGTFAVVSLMTGSVVEQLVPSPLGLNSSSSEASDFEAQRIGVASAVALLSGIIMLCMCGLQLGFLSTYLSEPIVKAFTSAAAFHVTISQLQSMLGLRLPRHTGTFSLFKTLASVMENLPHTNMAELLISMVCLAVLIPVKEINMRYRHRLRTPIPVEILTVIVATAVAYASSLDSSYNIEIVGHIPAGFPQPRMPALKTLPDIAGDTIAITFVGYAVSVSLAMIYADKHGYSIQPNQELLAHGISNTVSSFFTCFPSSATPTGSEQSFVVHSRESSCDSSCNLNSDTTTLPDKLVRHAQSSEIKQAEDSVDNSLGTTVNTQDSVFIHSEELCSSAVTAELHMDKDVDRDQSRASGDSPEGDELSEQLEETRAVTERTCSEDMRPGNQLSTGTCDDMLGCDLQSEPIRRSATSDSLEEYMDECCRLSEAQDVSSNPLGSGLGYLEHICQLIEKIGQLQETNLRLQRQICGLEKDSRMTKTKEDFFNQHCCCGAASLSFQHVQKRHSRSECLSPSGTLSDLSTIPEVTQHPLIPTTRDLWSEGLTPVPLWRRGLNRRSYTEGEERFLGDSTEGLSIPQRRLSENYTWGRVKDLVRKTKTRNQSRLGLTSASLKMSCPQLYRPDLGPVEPASRNRNSMIVLGHQSKMDFPWLQ